MAVDSMCAAYQCSTTRRRRHHDAPPFFPVEEPWRLSARYDHGVTMEVICQIRLRGIREGLYQGVTMELIGQMRPWVPWVFHGVAMDELSA